MIVGNPKFKTAGVDLLEEAHAVAVIASGGGDAGDLLAPIGVEAAHQNFAEIFAEHRSGGDGHALGFGFFAEDDLDGMIAAMQAVFRSAVGFADDFERPFVEHQAEEVAVMFAAALAVAVDDQILGAVVAQEMVEVHGGDGKEDAAFVAGGDELAVELFFGEDAGGVVDASGADAIHFMAQAVGEEFGAHAVNLAGEALAGGGAVPRIFVQLGDDVRRHMGEERFEVLRPRGVTGRDG